MRPPDWISLASAIVAAIAAALSIWFERRANSAAERAQRTSEASVETSLRSEIRVTIALVSDKSLTLAQFLNGRDPEALENADKSIYELHKKALLVSVEGNLNAYEEACAKYIDDKVDRVRFKKSYLREIQRLCEATSDNPVHRFLHPADTSHFEAIWKVYRGWNRLEQ